MTENETLLRLQYMYDSNNFFMCGRRKEIEVAMNAIKELEQYRAIGTVEEMEVLNRIAEETVEYLKEDKELLAKYKRIGTIDEFKALKEKNTPKKVAYQGEHEKCPTCGSFNVFGKHCTECGQAVDYD